MVVVCVALFGGLIFATLFSNPESNSETVIPKDFAIISSVSSVTPRSPRSITPTQVRCNPEWAAKSSATIPELGVASVPALQLVPHNLIRLLSLFLLHNSRLCSYAEGVYSEVVDR